MTTPVHAPRTPPRPEHLASTAPCAPVVETARALAPAGTLRLVLQHVSLVAEDGSPGRLRLLDAVLDVDGNLVPMRLWPDRGPSSAAHRAFEAAVATLDAAVAAHGGVFGYTLRVDVDGASCFSLRTSGPLPAALLAPGRAPGEIHDGRHQVQHHSDELEALRDALAGPEPGPVRRALRVILSRRRGAGPIGR